MNEYNFRLSSISVALLLFISACGDSDLSQIEQREIDAAQRAMQTDETDNNSGQTTGTSTSGSSEGSGENGTTTDGTTTDGTTTDAQTDSGSGESTAGTDTTSGATDADSGTDTAGDSNAGETSGFDLSGYELIFSDEFQADSLDFTKWSTAYQWGPDLVINDELQYYVDIQSNPDFGANPFSFDGESLIITATKTPDELLAAANNQPYLSGVLTTANNYTLKYGYIEARIDFPEGTGLWPAFWMLSAAYNGLKPQLFIAEYNGGKPNSIFHNYNYHDANGNLRSPGQWQVTEDGISEGFHTVGVSWEEQELLFYIDGVPRYRVIGENVSQQDMYFIANFAVGVVWAGAPDENTQFPAQTKIDYIRAYRKLATQ